MTALTRRKAMTAVVTAPIALAALPSKASEGEAQARDLWLRYIEAHVAHNDASTLADEADCAARQEISELECPWTPEVAAQWDTVRSLFTDERTLWEAVKVGPAKLEGGMWLVREFKPVARHAYNELRHAERPLMMPTTTRDAEWRWQAYPNVISATEALDASKAVAVEEWRSWRGRAAAIVRRHRVRPLEAEHERIFESCKVVAREIVKLRGSSAAARAVKLALFAVFELEDGGFDTIYQLEHQSLKSLYQDAVAEGGFDPLAEWRKTPGI